MSLLAGHTLLAVDTETTGFKIAEGARLLEVAVVPIVDGRVRTEEAWASFVQPGRPIPPDATKVHGITDAMVAGAPSAADVGRRLRAACADLPLVFHNAPFDLPFLIELFREAGVPGLLNPVVDTLGLARGLSGAGSNRLEDVARREGVPVPGAHRALADALMTAGVLVALAGKWERDRKARSATGSPERGDGVRSLSELAAISQDEVRKTTRR